MSPPLQTLDSTPKLGKIMNEWKASGGRITLFPSAPVSSPLSSALELYRRVWREDPDNFQKQANPLTPTVARGKRGVVTASCFTHPARIDFTLTPTSSAHEVAQLSFPLIEDTSQLLPELVRILDAIGEGVISDSIFRVALNVQFLVLKPSFAEANQAITVIIPSQYGVRITGEEDFVFQINRPYTSREVGTIKMNSLTKWSVDRLQVLTMAVPMGGAPTPASVAATSVSRQTKEFIAASVTFDNNNVPTGTPIPSAQQSLLLYEALTLAAQTQQDIGLNIKGFQYAKLSS
jgi:hypothetical protein